MSFKDITDGDKMAKPRAARFIKSKTGKLGIEVAFDFLEATTNTPESLNWVGWLTDGAMEFTMDTLINVLGFNGDDAVNEKGELPKSSMAFGSEVKIVVNHEEYNGKSYPRIQYVNRVGGSAFGACAPETLKGDLERSGFKAAFLRAKQKTGAPVGIQTPKATEAMPF